MRPQCHEKCASCKNLCGRRDDHTLHRCQKCFYEVYWRALAASKPQWKSEGYVCAALHRIPIAGCKDCDAASEPSLPASTTITPTQRACSHRKVVRRYEDQKRWYCDDCELEFVPAAAAPSETVRLLDEVIDWCEGLDADIQADKLRPARNALAAKESPDQRSGLYKQVPTSCACGGNMAWVRIRDSGAEEMIGCVCHTFAAKGKSQ